MEDLLVHSNVVKLKKFTAPLLWTLLIFILSSMPTTSLHLPQFWDLFSLDKLAHAIFYGVLFFLWHYSFKKAGIELSNNYSLLLLAACITYGGLLELYQGFFLTNRTADWVDELANTIGSLAGLVFIIKRRS